MFLRLVTFPGVCKETSFQKKLTKSSEGLKFEFNDTKEKRKMKQKLQWFNTN